MKAEPIGTTLARVKVFGREALHAVIWDSGRRALERVLTSMRDGQPVVWERPPGVLNRGLATSQSWELRQVKTPEGRLTVAHKNRGPHGAPWILKVGLGNDIALFELVLANQERIWSQIEVSRRASTRRLFAL